MARAPPGTGVGGAGTAVVGGTVVAGTWAAAAESIDRILAQNRPRLLICAGFAGGLDPGLTIADLVVAENLTDPDLLVQARSRAKTAPHCRFGAVVSRAETIRWASNN